MNNEELIMKNDSMMKSVVNLNSMLYLTFNRNSSLA